MVLNILLDLWISNAWFTEGNSAKILSNSLVGWARGMRLRESGWNREVYAGTVTDVAALTRHELERSTMIRKCLKKSVPKIS